MELDRQGPMLEGRVTVARAGWGTFSRLSPSGQLTLSKTATIDLGDPSIGVRPGAVTVVSTRKATAVASVAQLGLKPPRLAAAGPVKAARAAPHGIPVGARPVSPTIAVKRLGNGFVASATTGLMLGTPTIAIDNGNNATANQGYIFVENSLTSGASDKNISDALGVHHSVIKAIRQGLPDFRFESKIAHFARLYGFEPSQISGAWKSRKEKAWRLGSLQGAAHGMGGIRVGQQSGWFSLRPRPDQTPATPVGVPYQVKIVGNSGLLTLSTTSVTALPVGALRDNHHQIRTILTVHNGWCYVTLDGRDPGPDSYDLKLGKRLLGSSSESHGGGYRFDDMPMPGQAAGGPMFVDCELGLPNFTGDTYERYGDVYWIRQHPSAVRCLGGVAGATVFAAYEQVGD